MNGGGAGGGLRVGMLQSGPAKAPAHTQVKPPACMRRWPPVVSPPPPAGGGGGGGGVGSAGGEGPATHRPPFWHGLGEHGLAGATPSPLASSHIWPKGMSVGIVACTKLRHWVQKGMKMAAQRVPHAVGTPLSHELGKLQQLASVRTPRALSTTASHGAGADDTEQKRARSTFMRGPGGADSLMASEFVARSCEQSATWPSAPGRSVPAASSTAGYQ